MDKSSQNVSGHLLEVADDVDVADAVRLRVHAQLAEGDAQRLRVTLNHFYEIKSESIPATKKTTFQ